MKRKSIRYSFITVILVTAGLIYFAFSEYYRKHKDISEAESAFTLNSDELIKSFSENEKSANLKYLDKVLSVNGNVKSLDKDDQGMFTIVMGDTGSMSSVRCSMDSSHNEEAAHLKTGNKVSVKGICTGYNADELLGSDVILNRCIVK
jgi:hypothetical protein